MDIPAARDVSRTARALFFVHDGTSLGHLKRAARLMAALQGRASSLLATGMRAAATIVPQDVEIALLPGWDGMLAERAARLGRCRWWNASREESLRFRKAILAAIAAEFRPDIVVVDYLPYGQYGELHELLGVTPALKYLVIRGVVDRPDLAVLGGEALERVAGTYDRLLVAADPGVVDFDARYGLGPMARAKRHFLGYIADPPPDRKLTRRSFGVPEGLAWVVCSAGSGRNAEEMMLECMKLSQVYENIFVHILVGPLSRLRDEELDADVERCLVVRWNADGPLMNGAADIVVCGGGYNSVCEALSGGARIVVLPNQTCDDDEQRVHASLLSGRHPVSLIATRAQLKSAVGEHLLALPDRPRCSVDLAGAERFRKLVEDDLKTRAMDLQ